MNLVESFLVGVARSHIAQCDKGRELDHGVDFGEFSAGPLKGEREAKSLLSQHDPDYGWAEGLAAIKTYAARRKALQGL